MMQFGRGIHTHNLLIGDIGVHLSVGAVALYGGRSDIVMKEVIIACGCDAVFQFLADRTIVGPRQRQVVVRLTL